MELYSAVFGLFFSLCIVVFRFIHVEVDISIFHFLKITYQDFTDIYFTVRIYCSLFFHSPIDGHLCLGITIKAPLTTHVRASVQTSAFFSPWFPCTRELAALYGRCMFTFLRGYQIVFQSPILLSHLHCMNIPVPAHPQQHYIIGLLNPYHLIGT